MAGLKTMAERMPQDRKGKNAKAGEHACVNAGCEGTARTQGKQCRKCAGAAAARKRWRTREEPMVGRDDGDMARQEAPGAPKDAILEIGEARGDLSAALELMDRILARMSDDLPTDLAGRVVDNLSSAILHSSWAARIRAEKMAG